MKIILIKYYLLVLLLSSCSSYDSERANIDDYKLFPSNKILRSRIKYKFQTAENGKYPKNISFLEEEYNFDNFLEYNETVAFLIIKNDTIQYEKYFDGYSRSSIIPSFSMSKSFLSLLIGCAIDDGFIQSENDLVTDYLPELIRNDFGSITIKNLLQMNSGLIFNEDYLDTNSDVAKFYKSQELEKETMLLKLNKEKYNQFEYLSGNTQLLGLVLSRSLIDKNVSEYFQEKIWKKVGAEFDASWSTDNFGLEKFFCCFNATAIDYAKIGIVYLDNGKFADNDIVNKEWIEKTFRNDSTNGSVWYYQYNWWLPTKNGDFIAEGILEQNLYVNTSNNVIIVRLGKSEGLVNWKAMISNLGNSYQ